MTSWIELSRSKAQRNVAFFRRHLDAGTKLFAVVKGNAYGHGQMQLVSILKHNKQVDGFAVFELQEALAVRKQTTKPIMVLGDWRLPTADIRQAIRKKIILPVTSYADARRLSSLRQPNTLIHIKIDVGTRRLGIDYRQAVAEIKKIYQLPNLKILGIFSHFADSENKNQHFTHLQFQRWITVIHQLHFDNIDFKLNHIACTAAVLRQKSYQAQAIRLGLGLYGLHPYSRQDKKLQPLLSWKTRILQVKAVSKGDTIGYGQSYRVKRPGNLAIVPVGYYDGYDRRLSNNSQVIIKGKLYPVVGRICMNVMMVLLPTRSKIRAGEEVVLIGRQGRVQITADELADRCHSINYEFVTRLHPGIPRIICS